MSRQTKFAIFAAIIGNGIFGFSFMFSKIALNAAHPFVMLMYRFLLAFISLNGVALWSARSGKFSAPNPSGDIHWLRFQLNRKQILPFCSWVSFNPWPISCAKAMASA